VLLVAGLSIKNLRPRVWDPASPHHLPALRAVMVSYADFHQRQTARRRAMEQGLRGFLGVPDDVAVYLDNGAFYFIGREGGTPRRAFDEFVREAKPDWWPIPQDFIPLPTMTSDEQRRCFSRTMRMNLAYRVDGYVPVLHVGLFLDAYLVSLSQHSAFDHKRWVALGGIVPNLLRAPKAIPYEEILQSLKRVRDLFSNRKVHVFGLGGTATMHVAALLGIDSADSSGWRNRAARGIVQLPGRGDRTVADLGKWRGRWADDDDWNLLASCPCPACRASGLIGLKASGVEGFANRATHNLSVLLDEATLVDAHLADGTYRSWYEGHLINSTYLPLVRALVEQ
jgi:7-cyano-7-deazaguanine tRNA-ribosyltransferase